LASAGKTSTGKKTDTLESKGTVLLCTLLPKAKMYDCFMFACLSENRSTNKMVAATWVLFTIDDKWKRAAT
jgi:hypothetical protein